MTFVYRNYDDKIDLLTFEIYILIIFIDGYERRTIIEE